MSSHKTANATRMVAICLVGLFTTATTASVAHLLAARSARDESDLRMLTSLADAGVRQMLPAGEVEPGDNTAPRSYPSSFALWSRDCLLFPEVQATVLLDDRGQVSQRMPAGVGNPLAEQGDGHTWVVRRKIGGDGGILAGEIAVVGRRASVRSIWFGSGWMVAGAVLAVALLSFGFTIWWVRRKLAQPMERLIACLESREIGAARRMAGGLSCDLERLAEAIDCAVADLADGRDRLQHLDRTFDSRVAHQTRQYEHQIRKVTHKTYLDALTGLGNRRMLEEQADAIIQGQLKCGGELSVAMFDVDNFKMLNDTMGHAAGDALLRFLGELLRSSLRDSDIGIRYAGDEFIVLMPDTHPEQAGAMAERMARLFAQQTRHMELATPPTLSAGVTSLRTSVAASGNELIRAADEALYRAKNSGKDRTYVASGVRQG